MTQLVEVQKAYPLLPVKLSPDEQKQALKGLFEEFMDIMGLDRNDPSMRDTPTRVAKMYVDEIMSGLYENNLPKITVQPNFGYDEMLIETNITVNSLCEHHFVPIIGFAHIAYIPGDKVLGLSKFNRVTDYFCRRPQVQERLTKQIYDFLINILETEDVAVIIDAAHMCVRMRGVKDSSSTTRTSMIGGKFRQPETRSELFTSLPKPSSLTL